MDVAYLSRVKPRANTKPARSVRKRVTPAEDGVAAAQRVFAKVLEKADPKAKKPR